MQPFIKHFAAVNFLNNTSVSITQETCHSHIPFKSTLNLPCLFFLHPCYVSLLFLHCHRHTTPKHRQLLHTVVSLCAGVGWLPVRASAPQRWFLSFRFS